MLNQGHHEIEHLTDRFPEDALDEVWLPAIAEDKELVVVSADPRITTSKKVKEVWQGTGLTSFFFGGGFSDKRIWTQVLEVVRWWPDIVEHARDAPRGTGYLLPFGTKKLKVIYTP